MSTLSQFVGGASAPKAITNQFSAAGWSPSGGSISQVLAYVGAKTIASGALTASTLKTVLSITGPGCLQWLSLHCADATSRTLRMKLTIDGTVALDSTSAAIAGISYGGVYVGGGSQTYGNLAEYYFKSSLLVEIASSLTETDKVVTGVHYFTA